MYHLWGNVTAEIFQMQLFTKLDNRYDWNDEQFYMTMDVLLCYMIIQNSNICLPHESIFVAAIVHAIGQHCLYSFAWYKVVILRLVLWYEFGGLCELLQMQWIQLCMRIANL